MASSLGGRVGVGAAVELDEVAELVGELCARLVYQRRRERRARTQPVPLYITTTTNHAHQTWNWVIGSPGDGSFGSSFTSGSPGFDPVSDPSFSGFRKKAKEKNIKVYIFVKICRTVIEILTFNK